MAEQQQPLGESFPSSGECDARLYDDLSQYVATPRFLKAFETHGQPSAAAETHGEDGGDTNDGQPPAQGTHHAPSGSSLSPEQPSNQDTVSASQAGYVVVQQEDAVEAMAFYLAQCIAAHPEAQKLAPKQLQDALSSTLQGLKQTRFKQMCTYGRSAYRWSALTYSALQMYQNPWLIRAVITTIWAFSKLGMRAFV
uniref:Uncharacterized protein n=1 Tax=Dunaliella tertiolecta TaxID=3047 RepID=A0A7S3QKI0_DUNTE|mmetsp:Transcript_18563/g.52160  ORF Transcript_18563/g.52160 Transcript_18563/m.52160 type:complete len:196 (+) Transcript_18563:19-606(+)|eukprot:CAMPEP_0202369092 /NCGR_PEP_ID=MMETSP1127-20130417/982_1 /ASSEMBLY_ACC=CAM_ASM_000462 /TAXON_ID=3047 /ORGANISM="Dunaliella tertiolecta, Strain CCMP1320" /LENGTH=195 /DNA_ID=CAMNT_0048964631 /DNA_START=22 /DNA_END=609 /DNA_ORIENTATION=-